MKNCTLCRRPETAHLHSNHLYHYYICRECDLVFADPGERLDPVREKERYDQHENDPDDDRYRAFLNQLFKPLAAILEPQSYGLDYGAGPGPTLSVMLEEAGHTMEIYDPFYAKDDAVLENSYDFITSTETVEHFYNPGEEFERLWPLIKPGGYFGIMTLLKPEDELFSDWHYTHDETHVSFYSKRTFRWLAKHLGASLSIHGDRVSNSSAIEVQREIFEIEADWSEIFSTGRWDITSLFRAFEESGNGEILSSPSIKVMDGREGNIQVGRDFSIKQRDFAGNITDEFFCTGTILTVTPRVFYNDDEEPFIYMTVETERSTAEPDPVSTIVNKQEAATEVLMLSGESTVIAGLSETEVSSTRRGVPILKDLPGWFLGLRYLFGYNANQTTVQELLVLLKVELIPTLEERMNQEIFEERPELLQQQRDEFLNEIQEMQKQLRSAEANKEQSSESDDSD